jgi:hypothetical protein
MQQAAHLLGLLPCQQLLSVVHGQIPGLNHDCRSPDDLPAACAAVAAASVLLHCSMAAEVAVMAMLQLLLLLLLLRQVASVLPCHCRCCGQRQRRCFRCYYLLYRCS